MLPQASLVRRAVRRLWDYRFEAYTFQKVTHPDTHITETKLAVIEGGPWPCRISRKNAVPATGGNVSPSTVQQEIKLLCGVPAHPFGCGKMGKKRHFGSKRPGCLLNTTTTRRLNSFRKRTTHESQRVCR